MVPLLFNVHTLLAFIDLCLLGNEIEFCRCHIVDC